MVKLIALYKKPADVEAFEQHYAQIHIPLVEKIPGIRKTEWTRFLASPQGEAPYYMMYEMYFDSMDSYKTAMKSEENKAAGKDLMSFAREIVTLLPHSGSRGDDHVHPACGTELRQLSDAGGSRDGVSRGSVRRCRGGGGADRSGRARLLHGR